MSLSLLLPHSRVSQGPHPVKGARGTTILFAARLRVSHICCFLLQSRHGPGTRRLLEQSILMRKSLFSGARLESFTRVSVTLSYGHASP